ncbi:uncharacterized protein LOC120349674 [Nilaparvata lugens]|uniref:uncharacterized protein LOC120349674 n=1 Tax=Nilaparvata lugens TaxID=108931 RepID=UPI00193E29D7|nr:uncharacterized protein LOC120349674 [Nilaparvata lugens]
MPVEDCHHEVYQVEDLADDTPPPGASVSDEDCADDPEKDPDYNNNLDVLFSSDSSGTKEISAIDPTTDTPFAEDLLDMNKISRDEQAINESNIDNGEESQFVDTSHEDPSISFNKNATDSSESCQLLPQTFEEPRAQGISENKDENDELNPGKNCKKRVRKPDTWKDNLKKMKRNSGQSYTTKGGP